ncbi:MAG: polymer-forming cytoskeletal protein [Dehalococcoidia bacterium]
MLKKNTRDTAYPDSDAENADQNYASTDAYYTDPAASATRSRVSDSPEGRAAGAPRGQSVVDAHSTFDGRYETEQDLRVEGNISGEVVCRGELTVERDAIVNAKIEARDATVRGRVDGEVSCSGRLLLTGTAIVTGTFRAATLAVEEGATLRGTVETVQEDAPMPGRVTRSAVQGEPEAVAETPAREPAQVSSLPARNGRGSREVPSFALVSSDAPQERN